MGRLFLYIIAVFLMGWTGRALAQVNLIKTDLGASANQAADRLKVEFLTNQYLTAPLSVEQANSYQYVLPKFEFKNATNSDFLFGGDPSAVLSLSQGGESHFLFSELFAGFRASERHQFYFGRRDLQWSRLDHDLNLGLWQPLFRWDHARPEQLGLAGFFWEFNASTNFKVTTLISPLFLPDQQPSFETVDGKIVSGNRWFRAPISAIEIGNSPSDISYSILEPEAKDVVFNNSYALKTDWNSDEGVYLTIAFANKPINQFHLGIDTARSLRTDMSDRLEPKIHPVVVRHTLATFEMGLKRMDYEIFLSHTSEQVRSPEMPADWEQTELIGANYEGLGLRHEFALPRLPNSQLTWMYTRRERESSEGQSSRIEGQLEASTQRIAFYEWASVIWTVGKQLGGRKILTSNLGINFFPKDSATWLALDMTLQTNEHWSWYLGGDIFGVKNPETTADESFASIYRNNDRIQGGFSYVF